ncbi:MAG: PAS domain S-box protein, partial [Chitinophagaceae bacterium]
MIKSAEIRKTVSQALGNYLVPFGYTPVKVKGELLATFTKKSGNFDFSFYSTLSYYNGYQIVYGFSFGIDEIVKTKVPIRGEVSFPHATLGRRVYDYILTPVINDAGKVISVAGTTRDITELKRTEAVLTESERRFRDIADQSPMFVFIIEPNDEATISYWNKTWLEYTGQTLQEAIGRAWDGIIHPDDVET